DVHVAHHRPADQGDPPVVLHRRVQYLLHAVHVAGEAGHDHPLVDLADDVVEDGTDLPFRGHEPGDLGVGRIHAQQVDALVAEPREPGQVGEPPVEGQLVEFDVPGVQDDAGRGADRDRERIGDRVVHGEELDVEGTDVTPLA